MSGIDSLIGELSSTRERSLALRAILSNGGEMGIDKAIEKFGGTLSNTEKELLKSLTPEELKSLKSVNDKLGGSNLLRDNNNNNL